MDDSINLRSIAIEISTIGELRPSCLDERHNSFLSGCRSRFYGTFNHPKKYLTAWQKAMLDDNRNGIECMCCRVCKHRSNERIFRSRIFGEEIDYFDCSTCGYVQTEFPYWLDRAYSSTINSCDTGIMDRNRANVALVLATLSILSLLNGQVVDCAGGYGILVRLLRDRGIDALWSDPYCRNLLAIGFEHTAEKAHLVTAFEAFEHFVNPTLEVEKLFSIAPNLLVTTKLIPSPAPAPNEWWYYGLNHGQHIGFFRLQTLQFIANKFGKQLVTDGASRHLFTDKKVNSMQWNLSIRIAQRFPFIYGRRLESKTWRDFEKMSDK